MSPILSSAQRVFAVEIAALQAVAASLDSRFEQAVSLLYHCRGRVVCAGMGKTGWVLRKVVATLASTGTPALFVHPAEAAHGDLGMLVPGDVLVAASHSGSTREVLELVRAALDMGISVLALTASAESPLGQLATLCLPIPVQQEACPHNLAPTASTTALLAMGDALSVALMEARNFEPAHFARLHPGGNLGWQLRSVAERMVMGEGCPLVDKEASLSEAIAELSAKGLGIVGITDQSRLIGCLTDGDLRRLLVSGGTLTGTIAQHMHPHPQQVPPQTTLRDALALMHHRKITALFVTDMESNVLGVVQIHQLSQ